MPRLRLGVVGLGMAAAPHAKSLIDLRDRVEVVAAFSPSPGRRQAFSDTYGFPVRDSADAIFDDASIEAVMLLTPPNTHLELVQRASVARKHILLEKPLETSLERSELLVRTAEDSGVKLAIVLQHRFRPVARALAEIIRTGRLGELVSASARLNNWRPQSYYDQPGRGTRARDGGGVLLTQGIHTLDLLVSLVGLPAEVKSFCTTSPLHRMETEDLAMAVVRFGNGAIGSITATTCAYPGHDDAIDIIGTSGMARLDGARMTARFHDGSEVSAADEASGGGDGADPMAFSHEHHRAVLQDFIDAIRLDRPPLVTGREALKAHRLIEAILGASASDKAAQPLR